LLFETKNKDGILSQVNLIKMKYTAEIELKENVLKDKIVDCTSEILAKQDLFTSSKHWCVFISRGFLYCPKLKEVKDMTICKNCNYDMGGMSKKTKQCGFGSMDTIKEWEAKGKPKHQIELNFIGLEGSLGQPTVREVDIEKETIFSVEKSRLDNDVVVNQYIFCECSCKEEQEWLFNYLQLLWKKQIINRIKENTVDGTIVIPYTNNRKFLLQYDVDY
jgi:hypothetical protein